MKTILSILLFFCLSANATTYYVSNSGSDAAAGTSTGTAWQHISKVNGFSFSNGDIILLDAGSTFNEKLVVPHASLTISTYNIGSSTITSLQTFTGFANVGTNVWSKTIAGSRNLRIVFINGVLGVKARYPNTGYLNYTTHIGNTHIAKNTSGGFKLFPNGISPNWAGAEAVIRSVHWEISTSKITAQGADTSIDFTPATAEAMSGAGNGFFIQNDIRAIDTLREWSYDTATNILSVYSVGAPTVQMAMYDTLINVNHKDNVTITGLNIVAANLSGITLDTSKSTTINNCTINYCGIGVKGYTSPHTYITNSNIINSTFSGVFMGINSSGISNCDSSRVINTTIQNTGFDLGLIDQPFYDKGNGICIYGDSVKVSNNNILSSAYDGVTVLGKNSYIYRNHVDTFCYKIDDGGGIKQGVGSHPSDFIAGSVIDNNIITNGIGAPDGTFDGLLGGSAACNIYLDGKSSGVTITNNTMINGQYSCLNFNQPTSMRIYDNTISNQWGSGVVFSVVDSPATDLIMHRNIFLVQDFVPNGLFTTPVFNVPINIMRLRVAKLAAFSDSNYIIGTNKFDLTYKPFAHFNSGSNYPTDGAFYSKISDWTISTGGDIHSQLKPHGTIAGDLPILYYNTTQSDNTISLTGKWVDPKGTIYTGSVILRPMTSLVLMKYYSMALKPYR